MENYITQGELAGLLTILWLPVFALAAAVQWQLLSGRRWRALWVAGAFFASIALASLAWLSPIHRVFVHLDWLGPLFEAGGLPLQAALLAALLMTLIILALRRVGLPPNNSFKPNLLRKSA